MDYTDLAEKFPEHDSFGRSFDRLHLSTIYTDIETTLGFRKPTTADLTNPLWAEIGFIWEEVIMRKLNLISVGEIEKDNIVGTPDAFLDGQLHEIKCTWKSTKTHPKDVWRWQVQIQGYCHMLGVNTCKMHVLYLMGDYRGSGPVYLPVLFYFTDRELHENWQMLMNHAKSKGWL